MRQLVSKCPVSWGYILRFQDSRPKFLPAQYDFDIYTMMLYRQIRKCGTMIFVLIWAPTISHTPICSADRKAAQMASYLGKGSSWVIVPKYEVYTIDDINPA